LRDAGISWEYPGISEESIPEGQESQEEIDKLFVDVI
jgi:hypothetical protein